MKRMPDTRQTVLFSATLPKLLIEFARAGLKDPTMIRLDTDTKLSENLQTAFLSVRAIEKIPALLFLLREQVSSYSFFLLTNSLLLIPSLSCFPLFFSCLFFS